MADDVTLDPGAGGAVIATDEVSSRHYQWVKVAYGADGAVTPVTTADPLPVLLDAAALAALETTELGAATLAALESITVGTALPAGTNNIGDVDIASALPAGTNNIGDVDLASAVPAGTNAIGKVGHDTTGIGSGRKVVTTAGTRVTLAATTAAKWVTITAETDNTGYVVVGSAAGVIAALATREGVPLGAGDSVTLLVDDLAEVGLDSTVSGDGVTFIYGT